MQPIMKRHVVRPGECVISIAAKLGTSVDTIWDHGDNRALRERRPNPSLLKAGDVLMVPDTEPRDHAVRPTQSHRFQAPIRTTKLRVKLMGPAAEDNRLVRPTIREEEGMVSFDEAEPPEPSEGRPLGGVAYRLEVEGRIYEGTTGADGMLEKDIAAIADSGILTLEPGTPREVKTRLRIGFLDPIDEPSGVVQRLNNLGIIVDGAASASEQDKVLAVALSFFQKKYGLEQTGTLDAATRGALLEKHGI
jgi:N-acetylmuramoyl-L-alanine amidase